MLKKMKDKVKEYIAKQPDYINLININGEMIKGKYLKDIDIIVKVNINNFNTGFLNRDICRVIGETVDGKIVLQRLEDGHTGIVEKEQIKLPVWEKYDL